jgi:hypothetical protein
MNSKEAHESECYTCESCKQHFKRVREDKEAWDEYKKNYEVGKKIYPDTPSEELDNLVIICDDCYQEMKKKAPWLA